MAARSEHDGRLTIARRAGAALAIAVVFAASIVASTLAHLPTSLGRSLVRDVVNASLRDVFFGRVRVDGIRHIGVSGVRFTSISVMDERGDRVLHLTKVRARYALLPLVRSLLAGGPHPRLIQLGHIRAENADVTVIPDDVHGGITLSRALTPKPTPLEPSRGVRAGRPTEVLLPSIELGGVVGHFKIAALESVTPRLAAVQGSVHVAEEKTVVNVRRFGIVLAGLPAVVEGTAAVQVEAPNAVNVQFSGFAADSELQASFVWREGVVETHLSAPRLTPLALRKFLPQWPLRVPVALQARGNGTFERLNVEATASATDPALADQERRSEVNVSGELSIDQGVSARFTTRVDDLSLGVLDGTWPTTRFDAELTTALSYSGTSVEQQTTGNIPESEIGGVPVPAVTLSLTTKNQQTDLHADIAEPGARGALDASLLASGDLTARLSVPSLALDRQRRLPDGLRGRASLDADLRLEKGALAVNAAGDVRHFEVGGLRVARARLAARTERPVSDLSQGVIRLELTGTDVALGDLSFERADASATLDGDRARTVAKLTDSDGRQIEAQGTYLWRQGQLRDATLTARRGDLVGRAIVPLLDGNGPVLEFSELDIHREGCAGENCLDVQAEGRYAPGELRVKGRAENVALERLWTVLGVNNALRGSVDAEVDLDLEGAQPRGDVRLRATDVSFGGYPKTDLELSAHLAKQRVTGQLAATNALGIAIGGRAEGDLAGPALDPQSWDGATGAIELAGQLESLEPFRLLFDLPNVERLDGTARAKLTARRSSPAGYPTVHAEVDFTEVGFEMEAEDAPFRVEKHRVYANATFDPQRSTLYASGVIEDANGPLVRANGQVPVDMNLGPRLSTNAPLLVNAILEPREISDLPYFELPLFGKLAGQVTLYGTFNAPEVKVALHLTDLTAAALDDREPLSVRGTLHYSLPDGALDCEVLGVSGTRSVVLGKLDGSFSPYGPMFHGAGRLALAGFPLSLITPLSDLGIDGQATGILEFNDEPAPELGLQLEVAELTSGSSKLGRGLVEAHAARGGLNGQFQLQQGEQGLFASVDALSAPDVLPFPRYLTAIRAQLRTRQLNAAVFSPLLTGLVARLSGQLDSDLSLEWEREDETQAWSNRATGIAHLRQGRAYVEGVGLELQDVTVDVLATPLGKQTHVAFDRVQAKARSETYNVEGRGQILLSGAEVTSGSINAFLRDVPLTLQGLNLGTATGAASAQLQRKPSWDQPGAYFGKPYVLVDATLGNWRLRASPSASRSLIDTSPHSEITVIQGKVRTERETLTPYRISIDLGRDTQFSLADLDIPLSGETRIDLTDEAVVSGTIVLERGGRVPILGHVFEVQSGALRLNPNTPSNPSIDVVLSGQSKDGTPVSVTLTGTLQAPIVTPPLGQLNELLGGGTATAVSGGVQALGLNALLGDNVQFRVGSDANDQQLARYSAALQVRENLWFEVNYARSETNAFRTDTNNAVSGTLDYRFDENWSLRTEAGTTGGSVDIVWQYRY